MCKMIRFNYSAMTFLLSILLFSESDQTRANSNYQNPDPKAPTEAPKGSTNITCQDVGNLCPTEGVIKCCEKLDCRPNIVGGAFVCLPTLVPDTKGVSPENPKCQEITKVCRTYGDYQCCEGLSCSPMNRFGFGFCAPTGEKNPPTNGDQCQTEQQFCFPYGQYACCPKLSCVDPRTLVRTVPPGIGLCFNLEH